jgi:4-diphosphocytidyl-2-C-methyl-D-erythritol kinase
MLRAPAKLNLTLEVLARRADGLHGLRSVMVPVDLSDELRIDAHQGFTFACDRAELQEENLVVRAVHALGLPRMDASISLSKRIPTGAGMGGGSSDAAAILIAAQQGAFGSIPAVDYVTAARALGSDVPFFLVQTAALVEGTGERVTAIGPVPPWYAVVIKPPASISTAWAYAQIDAAAKPSRPRSTSVSLRMVEALQRRDFELAVSLLQNDFHDVLAPAKPEIGRALKLLRGAGASHALMTGSGSCVFALAADERSRDAIAEAVVLPEGYSVYRCAFWNGPAWRNAA